MAATAEGGFVAAGAARFEGADITFRPLLTVLNGSDTLRTLSFRSASATLHYYEEPFTAVGTVYIMDPRRHQRVDLDEVAVQLAPGEHDGYLILFENHDGMASFAPATDFVLRPQERTEFVNGATAGVNVAQDNRREASHVETVTQPHLAASAQGTLRYEGGGVLKLYGPDVVVRAGGTERVLRTGMERDSSDPVHKGAHRWAVVEFAAGRFEAASAGPWLVAGADVEASWEGVATFQPVSGSLRADGSEYVADGTTASLAGAFSARLGVVKQADAPLLTTWRVSGSLERTSLERAQVLPAAPREDTSGWALVVGALAVLSAAGGGALVTLHRRRHPPPPRGTTLEDCLDAATAAASNEDWPEAAEWFSRARRLAPTSARLCGDLAFALEQMGDHEEALRLYAEGSRLSSDGEADFNGGFAALRAGRPPAEVAAWLARALERSPEWVMDLEDDEALAAVRGEPAFEAAMERAWGRAGEDA